MHCTVHICCHGLAKSMISPPIQPAFYGSRIVGKQKENGEKKELNVMLLHFCPTCSLQSPSTQTTGNPNDPQEKKERRKPGEEAIGIIYVFLYNHENIPLFDEQKQQCLQTIVSKILSTALS